jgi:hypothetical protein
MTSSEIVFLILRSKRTCNFPNTDIFGSFRISRNRIEPIVLFFHSPIGMTSKSAENLNLLPSNVHDRCVMVEEWKILVQGLLIVEKGENESEFTNST